MILIIVLLEFRQKVNDNTSLTRLYDKLQRMAVDLERDDSDFIPLMPERGET